MPAAMIAQLETAAMCGGAKLPEARRAVARRIGVSPGTLESIRRGRMKLLAHSVVVSIERAFERHLESEIERLSHDLAMARARKSVGEATLGEAAASLEHAKKLLSRGPQ